jgi:uncharacterized protein (TIGR02453 family)
MPGTSRAPHTPTRFSGFPQEAIAFYEGLEADNSKGYWTAHRDTYETYVRAPLEALLAELAGEFGEPKVFRPYRDVRFSADKSPYKTHAAGLCGPHGARAHYVEVSADGMLVGAGYHGMSRDQLGRFRAAVADDRLGTEVAGLVEALQRKGMRLWGETLRTAPRGYPRDHERIDLLRRNDLVVVDDLPPGPTLRSRRALGWVERRWRSAGPLHDWLDRNVGPPRSPAAPSPA